MPTVLAGDSHRSVPRRPLVLIAVPGVVLLGALVAGFSSTDALIRATSACFIGVYVLALLSAVRILEGSQRVMAAVTLALIVVLAGFSGWYLAVPLVARRSLRSACAAAVRSSGSDRHVLLARGVFFPLMKLRCLAQEAARPSCRTSEAARRRSSSSASTTRSTGSINAVVKKIGPREPRTRRSSKTDDRFAFGRRS